MTEQQPLRPLATRYQDLLQTLVEKKDKPPPDKVLECLTARDRIAYLWREEGEIDPSAVTLIDEGDRQLREMKETVSKLEELKGWRESFQPAAQAWWWPEPPKPKPSLSRRFDWLWTALALTLLAISLSLIADIAARFLSGDTDAYGILAVVAPTILTLLTTRSVLTGAGQKAIQRILGQLKFVPEDWREELGFIASILLAAALAIFWFSLPQIARRYNDQGLDKYLAGEFAAAKADYERALKLDPGLLETHYNLGVLYEDLNDAEKAQAEYQLAVQGTRLDAAYNNLARLYILGEKYDQAVPLLITAQTESLAQDDKARYDINKNLGWARLGQERYDEAMTPLEEAIRIDPKRASAHCLMAQVLAAQKAEAEQVDDAWLACIQYADQTNPDEDRWLGMARRYFIAQETQGGGK